MLWHPDYAIQGMIKAVTAAISLATACLLWPLVPRALALPTTAQFQRVAEMLSLEVGGTGKGPSDNCANRRPTSGCWLMASRIPRFICLTPRDG